MTILDPRMLPIFKTIDGQSILGDGDIPISTGLAAYYYAPNEPLVVANKQVVYVDDIAVTDDIVTINGILVES